MQNFNFISIIIYFDLVRFLPLEKGISYLIHFNVTLLVLANKRIFKALLLWMAVHSGTRSEAEIRVGV